MLSSPESIQSYYAFVTGVFVDELQRSYSLPDEHMPHAKHYGLLNAEGEVISAYRIIQGDEALQYAFGQSYRPVELQSGESIGCISFWAVAPTHRARISLFALMSDIVRKASQLQLTYLVAKVSPRLLRFYRRQGFQKVGNDFFDAINVTNNVTMIPIYCSMKNLYNKFLKK